MTVKVTKPAVNVREKLSELDSPILDRLSEAGEGLSLQGDLTVSGTGVFNSGDSGATYNTNADDLVVESSGTGGISVLTPDANRGYIGAGSVSNSLGMLMSYDHTNNRGIVGTNAGGDQLQLVSGNGAIALTLNSAQTATFSGDAEVKRSQSSGQVKFTVQNQANAADSEDSRIVISNGGSSGGDAVVQYTISGVQSWATGIDNNDSDKFKIAHSSDVETNTALTIDTSGNATFAGDVDITRSASAATVQETISNSNNASATARARLAIETGGASGGDPLVSWGVSGVGSWYSGLDNSDSDKWKLSWNQVDLSSPALTIDTSNNVGIGGVTSPGHSLHVRDGATGAIPTDASIGVSDSNYNYIGFHNNDNLATFSGFALETRTTAASRWLIANEWQSSYLGDLVFRVRTGGSTSAERMRIDSSGNVGIGTTPKTWNTTDGATQIGSRLSLNSFSNEGDVGFNYYYSTGWKYTNADDACQISMGNGTAFLLQYAGAGSADAAITWTPYLTIDTSGNVGIGTTSPNVKVQVGDGTSSQNISIDGGTGTAEGGVLAIRQGGTYKGVLGTTAVIDGAGTNSDIRLQSYSDNIDIRTVAAKSVTITTNSTTALTIDSSQKTIFAGAIDVSSGTIKLDGNFPVGTENVALGDLALGDEGGTLSGSYNTAIGHRTLYANTTGYHNTVVGRSALRSNTTGYQNTAVGSLSLNLNATGINNTAIGYATLDANISGNSNVAVGTSALGATTASNNTAIGNQAGSLITTGSKNTIIGNYDGNTGGLDIRTSSNYIVLSDGDGNPRQYIDGSGNATFAGTLTAGRTTISAPTSATLGSLNITDSGDATVRFELTGGTADEQTAEWRIYDSISGSGKMALRSINDAHTVFTEMLAFDLGTNAATFAGTLSAGDTTVTTFTSNGIDDNATGERLQIGDNEILIDGFSNAQGVVLASDGNDATSSARLFFQNDTGGQGVAIRNTGGSFIFSTGAASQSTSGVTQLTLSATDATFAGNIVMAAGKGIDFSANSHASGMTSELLDDYEEGTWTPTLYYQTAGTSSFTFSNRTGTYTKIGRLVTVVFQIALSAFSKGTASGELRISGLPFSAASTPAHNVGAVMGYGTPWTAGTAPLVSQSADYIRLLVTVSNGTWGMASDPDSDSQYFGSVQYYV